MHAASPSLFLYHIIEEVIAGKLVITSIADRFLEFLTTLNWALLQEQSARLACYACLSTPSYYP
jgi:hypothetical protein